jgi:hypothetical protein
LKFLLELGRDRERDRFWPFAAEPQSHGRVQPALQCPPFSLAQSSEQVVASAGRTEESDVTDIRSRDRDQRFKINFCQMCHHDRCVDALPTELGKRGLRTASPDEVGVDDPLGGQQAVTVVRDTCEPAKRASDPQQWRQFRSSANRNQDRR